MDIACRGRVCDQSQQCNTAGRCLYVSSADEYIRHRTIRVGDLTFDRTGQSEELTFRDNKQIACWVRRRTHVPMIRGDIELHQGNTKEPYYVYWLIGVDGVIMYPPSTELTINDVLLTRMVIAAVTDEERRTNFGMY